MPGRSAIGGGEWDDFWPSSPRCPRPGARAGSSLRRGARPTSSPTGSPSLPRTRRGRAGSSTTARQVQARCPSIRKADIIVCTEDLSTMVSEAVSARLAGGRRGAAKPIASPTRSRLIGRSWSRNNWCRVLPIADARRPRPSPRRCPRSSRSRKTRSMRSPPSSKSACPRCSAD